ncbi:MAG TPA: hypothetical protein VG756_07805 [Pseudonocardiaceae bacterium]|nr:hypothetical protein [Pseudonocardiaceae bacterium]
MLEELARRHAWADDEKRTPPMTITAVSGADDERVTRVFGGDIATARRMTFEEAGHWNKFGRLPYSRAGRHCVQVVSADERKVVVIENHGAHGALPEIARRASANGAEFMSVHWLNDADYQVMHAVDGVVDAVFDPLEFAYYPEEDPEPPQPPAYVPDWAAAAGFHIERVGATSIALLETMLDVRVDPVWLLIPLRTVGVPPTDRLFTDLAAATTW